MKHLVYLPKKAAWLASMLLAGPAAQAQFGPATRIALSASSRPFDLKLADFNGDGKNDLLVGNANAGTVSIYLNTAATEAAAPSFAPVTTIPITSAGHYIGLALADVNGANRADLAATSFGTGGVQVLLNTTAQGADIYAWKWMASP